MQTRCQLKGSLNLSSGICRNRAVSFLFCTTWQHSLGNFLLLGNFLFHHEIEHALCTCLVVTATKKCESDRPWVVWNWQQTHRKSDTCLIFLYAAVAVKLTVRLTFGHEFCQYCSEFVKRQYIREFVHGWEGLLLTPNLLFSIPTAILTLFVRCNINSLDF